MTNQTAEAKQMPACFVGSGVTQQEALLCSRQQASKPVARTSKFTSMITNTRSLVVAPNRSIVSALGMYQLAITVALVLLTCCTLSVGGVKINAISPPQAFRAGSIDSIILDCDFSAEPDDMRIVLKWFLDSDPQPIYQWIPDRDKRTYSPRIREYVDDTFVVNDHLTRHRALRLLQPPASLSGRYTCQVSSIDNEQINSTQLTIYEPAKKFDFVAVDIDDPESVNFTCTAIGVFPNPELQLYKVYSVHEKIETTQIDSESTTVLSFHSVADGLWSITLMANIKTTTNRNDSAIMQDDQTVNDVSGEGVTTGASLARQRLLLKRSKTKSRTVERAEHYECRLSIPRSPYSETRRLAIQDGWGRKHRNNASGFQHCSATSQGLLLLALLLMIAQTIGHRDL